MPEYRPTTFGLFAKGLDSSTGELDQPKGSFPRGSNLILTKKGALRSCDGSLIVNAYNGVPTLGRGRAMCEFFYAPTGVAAYYLRLMKALDQQLGPPQVPNAPAVSSGGNLAPSTQYFYKITALDGAGGETTASQEVTATTTVSNLKITLSWNQVPNAAGYNIYRSTTSGSESLLVGSDLPVKGGTLTYADSGQDQPVGIFSVATATCTFVQNTFSPFVAYVTFNLSPGVVNSLQLGQVVNYIPGSDANFGLYFWTIVGFPSNSSISCTATTIIHSVLHAFETSTGGTLTSATVGPPAADNTQQTGLYVMHPAAMGPTYTNADLVALYPADPPVNPDGGAGGGGGGGKGGGGIGGGGGSGHQGSTPSGGVAGNVSLIPQIVQFTNRAVLALGNGFSPQLYSDFTGTPTNPATIVGISSVTVDANGVVTVTTSSAHNINQTQGIGANVYLSGITDPAYNTSLSGSSAFVVIAIPSTTSVKVVNLNAIGHAASSGGTLRVSTVPIISTFVPAYPPWTPSVSYAVNSIVQPMAANGFYYKAVQGGTSGGSQPAFPTTVGQQVADGQVIWVNAGATNTAAPPPPGCAHVTVYAGSLWMFNTAVTNTATGLDGPTSLRMSDVNNPSSWNPINQAFLDKDDGQEGMGLATFTIAAQGIPPEGSLVAMKKKSLYQIVGVFGSANFAIQRGQTDLGTVAPRTILFVPGFGVTRLSHLGWAVFDGVNDRVISTQVQPYFIGSNDPDNADITVIDQQWMSVAQSALTQNPPMYTTAIPIGTPGSSLGQLTRIMCFDLVLKAWTAPIDLPFPISTMLYVVTTSTIVVTLIGSYSDGTLQRWQAGDSTWATSAAGSQVTGPVTGFVRLPSSASKDAYQRLYCRRVVVTGQNTPSTPATVSITPRSSGVPILTQGQTLPLNVLDFSVQAGTGDGGVIGRRFDAVVNFTGQITFDAFSLDMSPCPVGVLAGAIA